MNKSKFTRNLYLSTKENKLVVYKFLCFSTNKKYIGITKNFKERINAHYTVAKANKGHYLHSAIRKYGKKNFKISIIDCADNWDELCEKEIYYIKKLKTKPPNGYNLTDGGARLGIKHSEESKVKMSKTRKKRIASGLIVVSNETRKKMSKAQKGKKHSLKTRKKMSESQQKFKPEQRKRMLNRNKNMSQETKAKISAKISAAAKGRIISEETRMKLSIAATNPPQERRDAISKAQKGNQYRLGIKHSKESRAKMSKSSSGKIHTEETKRKISIASKKMWSERKEELLKNFIKDDRGKYTSQKNKYLKTFDLFYNGI